GVEAARARGLNAPYLKLLTTGLPYVTAKWAMTLDGKTAASAGDSRWISSEPARRLVHERRGRSDAIIAGIASVASDNPLLTARPPGPRCAARIVLDSFAKLALDGNLVRTAAEAPVIVAVTTLAPLPRRDQLAQRGCEILFFPTTDRVPIIPLLQELGRRRM